MEDTAARRIMNGRAARAAAAALALAACAGCDNRPAPTVGVPAADSARIVAGIVEFRQARDSFLLHDDDSPLRPGEGVRADPPRWYPPDVRFYHLLRLRRYTFPRPVTIYGSKGEPRQQERYGYFEIPFGDTVCRINVYRSAGPGPSGRHLFVGFTDETTGKETYGVGRYLPVEDESADPNHLYEVDFNKATNPYCAYNEEYTCAVPPREDHIPLPVKAGELRYRL